MFDYSKLKGRIVEKFGTMDAFCRAYGQSTASFSMKLKNVRGFNSKCIMKTAEMLGISKDEIGAYFFTELLNSVNKSGEDAIKSEVKM